MEENESQNQQQSEGGWNDLTPQQDAQAAERQEQAALAPKPKNPDDTPTGELVADYEALLADIKVRKANQDDALKALDQMRAETVSAYEIAVKGASVEAAKLLVLISKRLGMPLNGAQPERYPSGFNAEHPGGPKRLSQSGLTPCRYCNKLLGAGLGMHEAMHVRRGDKIGATEPAAPKAATRWCEKCGKAIHVKGWTAHQGAHQRHGKISKQYTQAMSDEKIRSLLVALIKHQPIGSKEFGARIGQPNISAFTTGLKERGLAINNDAKWTVTPKGAAFIG